uniref:Uncharacterized protein n=1 Tax=Rhizophora mucronata TaxID=61149 RepID=A0A2P2Q3B2_RHIMU
MEFTQHSLEAEYEESTPNSWNLESSVRCSVICRQESAINSNNKARHRSMLAPHVAT